MRFVCSPTPKSALPCATRSSDSSGTVGTKIDSSSPSSRKNPFSFAATIGRWSGFRNHSSATVTICAFDLLILFFFLCTSLQQILLHVLKPRLPWNSFNERIFASVPLKYLGVVWNFDAFFRLLVFHSGRLRHQDDFISVLI